MGMDFCLDIYVGWSFGNFKGYDGLLCRVLFRYDVR